MIVHMFHALFDGPTLLTHVLTCMEDWSCIHTNKSNWSTLGGGGVGGGVSKCSPQADFKLPATPRKHRCPKEEGLSIYIYIYIYM